MKYFISFLIIIHGLIHIAGFVKAFDLIRINELKENISRPAGVLWLLSAILLIISAVLYFMDKNYWWILAAPAVLLSQILIILAWRDAKFGTIANLIILIPLIVSLAASLPSSYKNIFKAEAEKGLERFKKPGILTEEDIKDLPAPVRKYIISSGAVGKEKVQNFRAVFKGGIKLDPGSDFLDFSSVQYNFFDEPERLFFIRSEKFGIPFEGLHVYKGPDATMRIELASLFQIADAKDLK
jgi:hypothetical protein